MRFLFGGYPGDHGAARALQPACSAKANIPPSSPRGARGWGVPNPARGVCSRCACLGAKAFLPQSSSWAAKGRIWPLITGFHEGFFVPGCSTNYLGISPTENLGVIDTILL